MEKSELTVVIELLNGNYYRDFDQNIIDKVISIFSYLSGYLIVVDDDYFRTERYICSHPVSSGELGWSAQSGRLHHHVRFLGPRYLQNGKI